MNIPVMHPLARSPTTYTHQPVKFAAATSGTRRASRVHRCPTDRLANRPSKRDGRDCHYLGKRRAAAIRQRIVIFTGRRHRSADPQRLEQDPVRTRGPPRVAIMLIGGLGKVFLGISAEATRWKRSPGRSRISGKLSGAPGPSDGTQP